MTGMFYMKIIRPLVVSLGLSLAGLTHAAGYGVIDLERIVENSTYLKQQNASLSQSVKPSSTRLEQIGKEIEALRQKAQNNNKISETEAQKLSAQYQAKMGEFNTLQQSLQIQVQNTLQTMNRTFEVRVKQAAEQLRQENNLDLVLNKNSALAYDPKQDLTDKMIQKVNAIK